LVLPSGEHYAASGQGAGVLNGISIAVAPSRMIELNQHLRCERGFSPVFANPTRFCILATTTAAPCSCRERFGSEPIMYLFTFTPLRPARQNALASAFAEIGLQ
jgi:hypothetical protein